MEREKAARGVDGRFFPWGDFADPAWSCRATFSEVLVDSQVLENTAYMGGAMLVQDARAVCYQDDGEAAIVSNVSLNDDGVIVLRDNNNTGEFDATRCDLGTDSGKDNNEPRDFSSTETDYGDDETISCTSGGCTP